MDSATLITGYVDPDLDAVACMVGYAEYLSQKGETVVAGIMGQPHDEAKYLFDRFEIQPPRIINNASNFERIILVDASELSGLLEKVMPSRVVEIIDHRKVHQADKFPNAAAQIELVGAAATLIAEKFIHTQTDISRSSAILLYAAIVSNTLNFQAGVTTARDRQAAEWLNRVATLPASFWRELFGAKSDLSGARLEQRMRHDFAAYNFSGKKVSAVQLEILDADKLIAKRLNEIQEILERFKSEYELDWIFLNCIWLDHGSNYIICSDQAFQRILARVLGVSFSAGCAQTEKLLMRKEITPLLVKYFADHEERNSSSGS